MQQQRLMGVPQLLQKLVDGPSVATNVLMAHEVWVEVSCEK